MNVSGDDDGDGNNGSDDSDGGVDSDSDDGCDQKL